MADREIPTAHLPICPLPATPKEFLGEPTFPEEEYRQADCRRGFAGAPAAQDAGTLVADRAGDRRHHWDRHFHSHRHRGGGRSPGSAFAPESAAAGCGAARDEGARDRRTAGRRAGHCAVVSAGGHCLRAGGTVLRGTGLHDSHRGQRLHLFLRHARRNRGLDHRLGPDPGIRRQQHGGGGGLLRLH